MDVNRWTIVGRYGRTCRFCFR